MCNNVNNGIADFEVCGFTKNKKYIYIYLESKIYFLQIEKSLHCKLSVTIC